MTAQLSPTPVQRFFDNNGFPAFLGTLTTYAAGTTTPQATYVDSTQTTQNTNPIQLNARGECNLWLDPTLSYKFVLQDVLGNLIWTVDNINGALSPSSNIIPTIDNNFTLGSPTFAWKNIYVGVNHAPVLDTVSGNIGYYARTSAEIAAGVTPVNYAYAPGIFERYGAVGNGITNDYTAINNALLQSAQTGGFPAKALARKSYAIGANTLAIPDNGVLDISSASIISTNVAAVTFGSNTTLFGYDGATITSSGGSGAALKKTNTAIPAAFYIIGWPTLISAAAGTVGSVGLDFTASYKGVFEIQIADPSGINGYETCIVGGANTDTPQTYYTELRSPRIRCAAGKTGIKLQRGCNSTTIINPSVNGALTAGTGIFLNSSGGVGPGSTTILGGYIEGFVDNVATRGLLIQDAINFTIIGTTFDSAGVAASFAIGVTGVSTQCNFYGCGFASNWGSSTNIMSWASSGVFNFIGGAPSNQIMLLGLNTFAGGYASGETHIGKTVSTGTVSFTASAAAAYLAQLLNTGDGQGLLVQNNSANISSARSALSINRAGGPGYVLDFQNNGSASGGIAFGAGNPNGVVTGVKGTLYINTSGGAGTTLYVNEAGGTVWVGK